MELIRNNKQTLDMIADYYYEGMEGTKGKAANGDGGARYSIQTTENGKQYVEADRNVISGDNPSEWARQVEDYINNEIRHGRDVTVYSANGVPLTITADTAGKATFRNFVDMPNGKRRLMTDEEYARKLNAESHIDEIAQVSRGTGSTVPDRKNHPFAKDGFNYRTAYFKDNSGYYELRLSIGKNGNVNTIYNIGKITEADFPTRGLKGPGRSKTETRNTASIDNMPQSPENVKLSAKDSNADIREVNPMEITPPNRVTSSSKYHYLINEFENNGYNGRNVVLVENGNDGYMALTGSHRILAAREAGVDVPSVVIPMSEEIQALLDATGDEERARIADELYEDGIIPKEARDLLVREDELNYENSGKPLDKQVRFSMKDNEARKDAQFALIQNSNAAHDNYHTWIRSADEIKTLEETLADPDWEEYAEYDPDYTREMAEAAIKSGKITVYSSYKIGDGVFVTPSRMEAESYAADGKVYSKTVNVNDIAWIDPTQGQYAPVKVSPNYDYSKSFAGQLDDWKAGKIAKNDTLIVGATPKVFREIGFNALPVTINQTHVDYAINGTKNAEHHIGEAMLKQLPDAIKTPVAIIASETRGQTSVIALLPFAKDGKTIVVPVYVDGFGFQNGVRFDSNAITSIYGRENAVTTLLTNAIARHNNGEMTLFYLDKGKATALCQGARVTMPKMLIKNNGFVHSIRESGSPVKPKFGNVTESQQFKRWFGDWQNHPESASKVVNKDGTPKVVYHQTENEFSIFDTRHEGAGTRDEQTPFGIFLKSSSRDIGLRGKKQMALYADIRNPLVAQDRASLSKQLRTISPEYDALIKDHAALDAEYKQKFESAKNELIQFLTNWRKEHPGEDSRSLYGTPEFERVYAIEDSVVGEWTAKADTLSLQAKEVLTNALKNAGYDGIFLSNDEGSWGRETDAYIALDPNQVKSPDNIGTFSRSNPDIYFSRKDDVSVTPEDAKKLQKQNDKLKQALEVAKQEIKLSDGHHVKASSVERLAGKLLKEYSSKMDKAELVSNITELFDYIGNGENVVWDEVQAGAMNIALNVLDQSAKRNTEWYDNTKPAREFLFQSTLPTRGSDADPLNQRATTG